MRYRLLATIIIGIIAFSIVSCKKETKLKDTEPENNSFKFIINNNYLEYIENFKSQRAWLIIYSTDHETIMIQEIENGQTYTFDVNPNKYILQTVFYTEFVDVYFRDKYTFETHMDISPGTWIFGYEKDELNSIGTINLNLNDINLNDYYIGELKSSNAFYSSANNNVYEIDQFFEPDDVWLVYQNLGEAPYYKWFPNVGLNESLSVSSNEINKMDNYADISFPPNQRMYSYLESEDDLSTDFWEYYHVFLNISTEGEESSRVYYPEDLFSGYYSYFSIINENVTESMTKSRGEIPLEFEQLNASITINNDAANSYEATISSTADVCSHIWHYEDSVNSKPVGFDYKVYGPCHNNFRFEAPPIHEDIMATNPEFLNLNKLRYYSSSFVEYDIMTGYDSYIEAKKAGIRNIYKNEVKILRKKIYAQDAKHINTCDTKETVKRFKANPFDF